VCGHGARTRSPQHKGSRIDDLDVKGQLDLPTAGQENCPLVAISFAHWWPLGLPGSVGQWHHPLAAGCLCETDRIAGGDDEVGVVEEPVDGGVRDCFGHEFVESTWNWHRFDSVNKAW